MNVVDLSALYQRVREEMLWCIAQGLLVIPLCTNDHSKMPDWHTSRCTSPGKVPLVTWRDLTKVTMDDAKRWLREFERFNLGWIMGEKSGYISADIDGQLGREILDHHCPGRPATASFETPGGFREVYALPAGARIPKRSYSDRGRVHEELGILGDGSQTVMPPSIHHTRVVYSWVPGLEPWNQPIAVAPDSLLRLAAGSVSVDAPPSFDRAAGEAVLASLAAKCTRFAHDWEVQRDAGVSEDAWFCMVALLVKAKQIDAAWTFSSASRKHNAHSAGRIRQLIAQDDGKGLVRCTRFGCSEAQVKQCFGADTQYGDYGIRNTPGSFIDARGDDILASLGVGTARDGRTLKRVEDPKITSFFSKIANDTEDEE